MPVWCKLRKAYILFCFVDNFLVYQTQNIVYWILDQFIKFFFICKFYTCYTRKLSTKLNIFFITYFWHINLLKFKINKMGFTLAFSLHDTGHQSLETLKRVYSILTLPSSLSYSLCFYPELMLFFYGKYIVHFNLFLFDLKLNLRKICF